MTCPAHALSQFPDTDEKILLFFQPVIFYINHDPGRGIFSPVRDAIQKILKFFQGMTIAPDQATGITRQYIKHLPFASNLFLNREDKSQMTKHQLQRFLGRTLNHSEILISMKPTESFF